MMTSHDDPTYSSVTRVGDLDSSFDAVYSDLDSQTTLKVRLPAHRKQCS